jgi:hypothetical protein
MNTRGTTQEQVGLLRQGPGRTIFRANKGIRAIPIHFSNTNTIMSTLCLKTRILITSTIINNTTSIHHTQAPCIRLKGRNFLITCRTAMPSISSSTPSRFTVAQAESRRLVQGTIQVSPRRAHISPRTLEDILIMALLDRTTRRPLDLPSHHQLPQATTSTITSTTTSTITRTNTRRFTRRSRSP